MYGIKDDYIDTKIFFPVFWLEEGAYLVRKQGPHQSSAKLHV